MIRRLFTAVLLLVLILLGGAWLHWSPVVATAGVPLSPLWAAKRSIVLETTLDDARVTAGSEDREVYANDPNSTGTYRITAICAGQGDVRTARVAVLGHETGRESEAVSATYVLKAAPDPRRHDAFEDPMQVWSRDVRPGSKWHRGADQYRAGFALSMCPALLAPRLVRTLSRQSQSGSFTSIHGRPAAHLHFKQGMASEGAGNTVDLYVDVLTLHWLRVDLSGWGPGCCGAYRTRVDYLGS